MILTRLAREEKRTRELVVCYRLELNEAFPAKGRVLSKWNKRPTSRSEAPLI